MNALKFRINFKLAKICFHISMLIWMCSTIFFQFKYGWHWTATQPDEKLWDKIFMVVFMVSAWLYIRSTTIVMQALCDATEGSNEIEITKEKND